MGAGCPGLGRPPLSLGTHGAFRFYRTDTGYRARALVRDYDGRTRHVERHGATKAAAERALKLALRDRRGAPGREGVTGESTVSELAEAWHAALTAATLLAWLKLLALDGPLTRAEPKTLRYLL